MWQRLKHHRLDRLSKTPKLTTLPRSSKVTGSSSPKAPICRQFTIAQIRSATKDFNKRLLIGRGEFGVVYKGTLENGTIVAIKRLKPAFVPRAREFQAEVDLVRVLQHRNIVGLIGYCNDGKEMILVYEYMCNRTLSDHLHKHRTPLSWPQRLKICIDIERALNYYHNATCGQEVIQDNVQSSDILLDNQWGAKIKDFGWSKIIAIDDHSSNLRLRKKSNVYSVGVLMLEILCRRLDKGSLGLDGWAFLFLRTRILEQIIDPDLTGKISRKFLNDYARIVECCLRGREELRITMGEVVFGLESILALEERMGNSVPQMSIITSDGRLQKYFFSSGQNSG